jgi:hypothetical protein
MHGMLFIDSDKLGDRPLRPMEVAVSGRHAAACVNEMPLPRRLLLLASMEAKGWVFVTVTNIQGNIEHWMFRWSKRSPLIESTPLAMRKT